MIHARSQAIIGIGIYRDVFISIYLPESVLPAVDEGFNESREPFTLFLILGTTRHRHHGHDILQRCDVFGKTAFARVPVGFLDIPTKGE